MPIVYNGGQSPLEAAAIAQRNILIPINTYNNYSVTNEYTASHTRALADSSTPINGKGTGDGYVSNIGYAAIVNYAGGSEWDILGNQMNSVGSGRNSQITLNAGVWGYGPNQVAGSDYSTPNTSGNIGQVII